jgi:hypothetical protein
MYEPMPGGDAVVPCLRFVFYLFFDCHKSASTLTPFRLLFNYYFVSSFWKGKRRTTRDFRFWIHLRRHCLRWHPKQDHNPPALTSGSGSTGTRTIGVGLHLSISLKRSDWCLGGCLGRAGNSTSLAQVVNDLAHVRKLTSLHYRYPSPEYSDQVRPRKL